MRRPPTESSEQGTQPTTRQWVKFSFFKIAPDWRLLDPKARAAAREEFTSVTESFGDRMLVRSFSLTGLRGDADFLIWQVCDQLEQLQHFSTAIFSTAMAPYLSLPYSYLAMTRRSIYRTPSESNGADARLRVQPGEAKYLFVYPFVKTRPWYEQPKNIRQQMMDEHIAIGKKYPSVKLNTTYSYGIDDQEFVVSFETDSPSDFLDLVMELRETKSSSYTLRDTPTFTCISMPLADALLSVGAPGDAVLTGLATAADGDQASAPVATIEEVPEGAARVVHYRGDQIALFNVRGRVYAISNRCSHANGPLGEGKLQGTEITCPWHDSKFDLLTGKPSGGPAQRPVTTYDVRIDENGRIFLTKQATAPTAP